MLGIRREQKRCFSRSESGDLWDMPKGVLLLITLYYSIVKYLNIVTFKYLNLIYKYLNIVTFRYLNLIYICKV